MRTSTCLMMLAAPLVLAACDAGDQASDAQSPSAATHDAPMSKSMPMTPSGEDGQTASGEGTVTALDSAAGTITIDHGPISAVGWPAMTMSFKADAAIRQGVAEGDEVTFAFRKTEVGGEITSIARK